MFTQDHAWKTQYTRINKSYERKYHKFEAIIFFLKKKSPLGSSKNCVVFYPISYYAILEMLVKNYQKNKI